MTLVPSLRRFAPALLAAAALLVGGCASGGGSRVRGVNACGTGTMTGPCSIKAPPTDLPQDPNPRLKYCRVWVPPVYRKVPKLVEVCGCTKPVDTEVTQTRFVTQATPGRCYGCTTPTSCQR